MSNKLVVFTGAGLSADSGLRTFRDSNGLWEEHDVDQIANIHRWKQNFDLVHRFYNERRVQAAAAEPNAAHRMVADWQRRYPTTVITQNVDGLLEKAGCTDVLHVHGSLNEMKCEACGHVWEVAPDSQWAAGTDKCPLCPSKKGVKPGVIFFGEIAPGYGPMCKAFQALEAGDVLMVIGTSGQVVDIGTVAATTKAYSILSNLEAAPAISFKAYSAHIPTLDDNFDLTLHGRASEMATRLDLLVQGLIGPSMEPVHG